MSNLYTKKQKPISKKIIPKDKLTSFINTFSNHRRVYIVLFFATFILYANSIMNDYNLDDVYVTNNEQVKKGIKAIPEIFTSLYVTNVFEEGHKLNFGYRPLVKATFALEYSIWGDNPHLSHLMSVLLYFFTVLMVFIVVSKLLPNTHVFFPFLISLLFLIHPLHTEVVCSLKNRDELLSLFFSLLSLLFFTKYVQKKSILYLIGGTILFLLAYLSKLSALVFMVIIPFVLFFIPDVKKTRIIWVIVSVVLAYIILKYFIDKYLDDRFRQKYFIENPMLSFHWFDRIPTALFILLFYLKMLFLPFPMRFYYGYNTIEVKDWGSPVIYFSMILYIALIVVAILSFKKNRWLFYAVFLYLFCIVIYTNVVRIAMGIVADRFLYAASFGFSVLLAGAIYVISGASVNDKTIIPQKMRKILILSVLIILFAGFKVIERNKQWKDQFTLVEADIDKLSKSARANFIYAGMLEADVLKKVVKSGSFTPLMRQRIDKAVKHLQLAIDVYPEYYQAYQMLGTIHNSYFGDIQKAEQFFRKAVDLNPNYVPAISNLAYLCQKQEKFEDAIHFYKEAIAMKPFNQAAQYEALLFINNESAGKPLMATLLNNLADIYKQKGDTIEMNKTLKEIELLKNLKKEDVKKKTK